MQPWHDHNVKQGMSHESRSGNFSSEHSYESQNASWGISKSQKAAKHAASLYTSAERSFGLLKALHVLQEMPDGILFSIARQLPALAQDSKSISADDAQTGQTLRSR